MKAISLPIRDTFVSGRVGVGVWCLHSANLLSRKRYINYVQCKQRQITQRLHYCGFQNDIKHVRQMSLPRRIGTTKAKNENIILSTV